MLKRMLFSLSVFAASIVFAQSKPSAQPQKPVAHIPFMGCEADGQIGPVKAPASKSRFVPISADLANRLAYYKSSQGLGVLAPRGWSCFGVYGSNGYALYVSPERITAADLFSGKGFAGPAVELEGEDGGTSGRFGVARVIARVFPARKSFVERVIAEGIAPASSFPFGSYPADKLTYRSQGMVEYKTPANAEGLGTASRLKKNAHSIGGVEMLIGETPDLVHLAVRLAPDQSDLASPIIQRLEDDAEQTDR